ncbi:hypothetical protein ACFX5E_16045, partial [Flavobacterium sp. LS2P90]
HLRMYFAPIEFGHFVLFINCYISKIHFHIILTYVKDMSPDRSGKPGVSMAYILYSGKATNGSSCSYLKMLPTG